MLRRIIPLILAACLASPADAQNVARPKIVIEIIVDNGGTNTEAEAQELINNFIGGIAQLRGRAFSNARLDLILTSNPTTVWSGTPRELIENGHHILRLVQRNDRCSDVGRALRQADQNLKIARPGEAYLLIYSPLIFAPFPCDSGPGIVLPQAVPGDVGLGRMIDEHAIKSLKIFGVHSAQERVWTDYLGTEGLLTRAREGRLDLTFLGFAQSRAFLAKQKIFAKAGAP